MSDEQREIQAWLAARSAQRLAGRWAPVVGEWLFSLAGIAVVAVVTYLILR